MEKYCKSCGRVFKDSDFKICPYCGNQLSTRTGRQPIPRKLRHEVFQRDGYRCRECGATNKQTRLHVDHIVPVAKGGTNDLNNLQTLCEECNRAKYTDEWVGGIKDNDSFKRNSGTSDTLYELNRKQREINLAIYRGENIKTNDYNNIVLKENLHSRTKRCPNCNTVINRKAKKCIKCGEKIKSNSSHSLNNNSNQIKEFNKQKELNLTDVCSRIIEEFKIYNDINFVSRNVGIPAVQIKKWYMQGKKGDPMYLDFYNILLSLNPKMDIVDLNFDLLPLSVQLDYIASSFKRYQDIKLVSKHTGVSEILIREWFELGRKGQWPHKIFFDHVSKWM